MSWKSFYVQNVKLQKWRKYLLFIKKVNLRFKSKAEFSPYSVAVPSACKELCRNLGWQSGKQEVFAQTCPCEPADFFMNSPPQYEP